MEVIEVLSGHCSPESAYLIGSYPFGRRRCMRRVWIETRKGHGQRVCAQTTKKHIEHNTQMPAGNTDKADENWNKAKKSTYSQIRVLFLDEIGHVQNDGLGMYSGPEDLLRFRQLYFDGLDDQTRQSFEAWETVSKKHRPDEWAKLEESQTVTA